LAPWTVLFSWNCACAGIRFVLSQCVGATLRFVTGLVFSPFCNNSLSACF